MEKFYSMRQFSEIIGVSHQTLRNWDASGKLHPHHLSPGGRRYYSMEQLNQATGVKNNMPRVSIGYCRVSSNKKKDDLERQIESVKTYLTAQGKPYEIISDIGSGIDCNKKGFQSMVMRIEQNQVEKVVILDKDRLLRFGFELVEYVARLHNCEIEIIDNTEKSEQTELVEDFVHIVALFAGRLKGKQANKARKLVRELTQEEGDADDEVIQSPAEAEQ